MVAVLVIILLISLCSIKEKLKGGGGGGGQGPAPRVPPLAPDPNPESVVTEQGTQLPARPPAVKFDQQDPDVLDGVKKPKDGRDLEGPAKVGEEPEESQNEEGEEGGVQIQPTNFTSEDALDPSGQFAAVVARAEGQEGVNIDLGRKEVSGEDFRKGESKEAPGLQKLAKEHERAHLAQTGGRGAPGEEAPGNEDKVLEELRMQHEQEVEYIRKKTAENGGYWNDPIADRDASLLTWEEKAKTMQKRRETTEKMEKEAEEEREEDSRNSRTDHLDGPNYIYNWGDEVADRKITADTDMDEVNRIEKQRVMIFRRRRRRRIEEDEEDEEPPIQPGGKTNRAVPKSDITIEVVSKP